MQCGSGIQNNKAEVRGNESMSAVTIISRGDVTMLRAALCTNTKASAAILHRSVYGFCVTNNADGI